MSLPQQDARFAPYGTCMKLARLPSHPALAEIIETIRLKTLRRSLEPGLLLPQAFLLQTSAQQIRKI